MTVVLVLLMVACVVWLGVRLAARSGSADPQQSVKRFSRALHALAPAPEQPQRRGWRRSERS